MDRELFRDYLQQTGMETAPSEALSRILAQMATKDDLRLLEERVDWKFEAFGTKLESLKTELTWRMVAAVALFATIMTVLDLFVDWPHLFLPDRPDRKVSFDGGSDLP